MNIKREISLVYKQGIIEKIYQGIKVEAIIGIDLCHHRLRCFFDDYVIC